MTEPVTVAVDALRERQAIGERARRRTERTAVLTALTLAAVAVIAAALFAVLGGVHPTAPGTTIAQVTLVALYVVAYRIEFRATGGSMVPTQPVLVAMLVVGPVHQVPLAVLVGVLLGSIGAGEHEHGWYGWAVRALPAWHSFGPVVVLLVGGVGRPTPADWPVLLLALIAQFTLDAGTAVIRLVSLGVSPRALVRPLGWTFGVDTLMAVIGAGLAFSAEGGPPGVVVALAVTPVLLVFVLGRDREHQVQQAESLGAAFEHANQEATTDSLTGIGNRRRWDDALARAQSEQEGQGHRVVVLAADLDGLKVANDRFGHDTGDALIRAFADVLRRAASTLVSGEASWVGIARLGGDEFGLVIAGPQVPSPELVIAGVRELIAVHPPVNGVALSASLGVASCPPCPRVVEATRIADERAAVDKQERAVGRR
ncbi:MAG: GGDEF domain-containing protein [Kineosporiaceae bacterium]|nr:GGDEF domain-containing protein [Kineosporiaceae bacterium]